MSNEGEALYLLSVKSDRSTFTVGFQATDDQAAALHAIEWVAKAHIPRKSEVFVVRPDGSKLDMTGSPSIVLHS